MFIVEQMKLRKLWKLLPAFIVTFAVCQIAFPQTKDPMVVVFYQEDCPDCARMEAVLEELLAKYPALSISYYEVNEPGSSALLEQLSDAYRVLFVDYPLIFVGEDAITGAGRAKEIRLRTAIETCIASGCPSPLSRAREKAVYWNQRVFLVGAISMFVLLLLLSGD